MVGGIRLNWVELQCRQAVKPEDHEMRGVETETVMRGSKSISYGVFKTKGPRASGPSARAVAFSAKQDP